jgi:hypothetical protein
MKARGEISPEIVEEFDKASKGMKLPKRVEPKGYAGGGEQDDQDDTDSDADTSQPTYAPAPSEDEQEGGAPTLTSDNPRAAEIQRIRERVSKALQTPVAGEETPARAPAEVASGGVPGAHALDLQQQIAEYLNKQKAGGDAMEKLYEQYKTQLAQQNNRPNQSGFNALMEYYYPGYGAALQKGYQRPLTQAEQTEKLMGAQQAVNKGDQPIAQELLREYASDNNAATRNQAAYYRALAGGVGQEQKASAAQQKAIDRMHDDMFLKRGTNPQVSQSLGKLQRATSAIALMDQIPASGPIPGEMSNIASSLAGLVTGGNTITDEKLKEILPNNVELTAAGIKQWLTSEPQGADQQAFLQRFRREIDGETKAARNTIGSYQDAQADSYVGRVPPAIHDQRS